MQLLEHATTEKLRGSFYSPKTIADFILKWAFNGNEYCDMLEPSCGDGIFLESLLEGNFKYNSVTSVEIDRIEASKARKIPLKNSEVIVQDFHVFCNTTQQKFDIIVGNPPYIRYQYFSKEQQKEAEKIFKDNNVKYSKLMNSWCAFVIGCTSLLKEDGKLGFVLPAEILQVTNAKQIRDFLIEHFCKISIISFKKLVFTSIQQDVILLLCEKGNGEPHIEHIEAEDDFALKNIDMHKVKNPQKNIYSSSKWTNYFLEQKELDFLNEIKSNECFHEIADLARVEVGITTGANDFFSVDKDTIEKFQLQDYVKPLVGRSVQVNGLAFNEKDWLNNFNSNTKSNLLVFPKIKKMQQNKKVLQYIEYGKEEGFSKGYKCRIREEWQIVPSVVLSDAFFSRRNNIYAKIILNEAQAYTTDTMHRVWINENVNKKAFVASYYNSLSLCFVELEGRSFGGGALELMPSEVENIIIPYDEKNNIIFDEIDSMQRSGTKVENILNFSNNKILIECFGLNKADIKLLEQIRLKFLNKRLTRKYNK